MMTLKEFFISSLAMFEADVLRRATTMSDFHTMGMCDALCDASIAAGIQFDDFPYNAARETLREYMPTNASTYWFPIYRDTANYDECILPRRAILQAIIDSL